MRTLLIAAVAVMAAGASYAQGLPAGTTPNTYGADAFPTARHHDHSIMSEWLRGSKALERKAGTATPPGTRIDRRS